MISVKNLTKYYGDFQALKGISFEIKSGRNTRTKRGGKIHDFKNIDMLFESERWRRDNRRKKHIER